MDRTGRREDPPELWERSLHLARAMTLDEVKEQLVALGRERGSITSADLVEAMPEMPPDQIEDALAGLTRRLTTEGIEVIEVPGDDTDAATQVRIEVDLLRAPTNDMVRMYLKEIGKVPLLNAAQEVDLARRIEAGELSTDHAAPTGGRHQARAEGPQVPRREGVGDPRASALGVRQGGGDRPRQDRQELSSEDRGGTRTTSAAASSATVSSRRRS